MDSKDGQPQTFWFQQLIMKMSCLLTMQMSWLHTQQISWLQTSHHIPAATPMFLLQHQCSCCNTRDAAAGPGMLLEDHVTRNAAACCWSKEELHHGSSEFE